MISYKDILQINDIFNRCINKGLSTDAVINLIDFKDEIQDAIEKYQKVFRALMDNNEVPLVNNAYNWAEMANVEFITNEVTVLLDTEIEIKPVNFLDTSDLVKLTEGLSFGEISYLRKFLRK